MQSCLPVQLAPSVDVPHPAGVVRCSPGLWRVLTKAHCLMHRPQAWGSEPSIARAAQLQLEAARRSVLLASRPPHSAPAADVAACLAQWELMGNTIGALSGWSLEELGGTTALAQCNSAAAWLLQRAARAGGLTDIDIGQAVGMLPYLARCALARPGTGPPGQLWLGRPGVRPPTAAEFLLAVEALGLYAAGLMAQLEAGGGYGGGGSSGSSAADTSGGSSGTSGSSSTGSDGGIPERAELLAHPLLVPLQRDAEVKLALCSALEVLCSQTGGAVEGWALGIDAVPGSLETVIGAAEAMLRLAATLAARIAREQQATESERQQLQWWRWRWGPGGSGAAVGAETNAAASTPA